MNLKWPPIALKFLTNAEEAEESALARKAIVCEAFDIVRRDKSFLRLSKKSCDCSGSRHLTGLQFLPVETIANALTRKGHMVFRRVHTSVALEGF